VKITLINGDDCGQLSGAPAPDDFDDAARARLHQLAARLKVSDRVLFQGSVIADELPAFLRSAHLISVGDAV